MRYRPGRGRRAGIGSVGSGRRPRPSAGAGRRRRSRLGTRVAEPPELPTAAPRELPRAAAPADAERGGARVADGSRGAPVAAGAVKPSRTDLPRPEASACVAPVATALWTTRHANVTEDDWRPRSSSGDNPGGRWVVSSPPWGGVMERRRVSLRNDGGGGNGSPVNETRAESWTHLNELLFADSWHERLRRHRSDFVVPRRGRRAPRTSRRASSGSAASTATSRRTCCATSASTRSGRTSRPTRSGTGSRSRSTTAYRRGSSTGPTRRYVALHFATASRSRFREDGAIWMVDFVQTNALLPRPLRDALELEGMNAMSADLLERQAPTLGDFDRLGEDFVVFFEPPALDDRIVNQYALFSLMPSAARAPRRVARAARRARAPRIVIPAELKWEVRDKLDQANITERVLFPGLDGLATWLKRYFSPRS